MPRPLASLPVLGLALAALGCGNGGAASPPFDGPPDARAPVVRVDAMPMGCIDIPAVAPAAAVSPLDVTPQVLVPRAPLDVAAGKARGPVITGDRIIVAAGNWAVRYHLNGELDYSAEIAGGPHNKLGRPTVTDDGRVWSAGETGLFGLVDAEGSSPGGAYPYDDLEESTRPAPDILTDGEYIYVGTGEGELVGGAASSTPRWRRTIGEPGQTPLTIGPAAGRVLAAFASREVGSWLWDADTGEPLGVPRGANGGWVYPQVFASGIGLIGLEGYYDGIGDIVALDRCGLELWRHSTGIDFPIATLVGFDDQVFVWRFLDEGIWVDTFVRLSSAGEVETPTPLPGRPMVLGADGVLYVADCVNPPENTDGTLVAYDRDLVELWRFPLGFCPSTNPVLLEDGRLYLAGSSGLPAGYLGMAIVQTTSPGLAPTAWPAPFRDNRSTSWLRSPVP